MEAEYLLSWVDPAPSELRILSTAELRIPAFPCVNPADEVIPEEVNLSIRPLLYTSVCTSNLGRPRREIGGSLFRPSVVGGDPDG